LRVLGTSAGDQMWAARFEGMARDVFALEDSASRGVRSALAPSPREERVQTPPTSSPEAYDLYLRGKIRVRRENEQDDAAAIALFERAVALDPDFAAAQAELSHAYALRVSQFAPGDASALESAELAAEKALRAKGDLAEGHYAAGFLLWGIVPGQFGHEGAVRELKRAVALNPNLDEAHHQLGMIYLHIGLLDQAVAEFQEALALNPVPTNNNPLRRIGIALIYRGQYEEGLKTFLQVPAESNSSLWHYQVAWALLYLGRNEEARTLIEQYLLAHPEDRGGVVTSTRAIWFAKAGDAHRAEADIRTAVEKGKGFIHFHHTAYNIASAYALLGQAGPAHHWLRVAAETGWPCYPYFANDPNLERIHGDAGYVALMRELKAQWERHRATL
jgi:tetratricopeptide (TPR) repeat protein